MTNVIVPLTTEQILTTARLHGYIRCSADDQNEARQLDALMAQGIDRRDIYIDKQSGKNFDRPEYQRMRNALREGDTLFIHSLDRFGRNKEQILEEWNHITKVIKAYIVVLDMPILDTRKKDAGNLGELIADIVLQVLAWIAEDERNRIRKRQREGIDSALARGQQFGRPKMKLTPIFYDAYRRWKAGEINGVEATKMTGVSKNKFYRMVRMHEGRLE